MEKNSYTQAFEYALNLLAQKLPTYLTYHSYSHTVEEVLPAAQLLAKASGLPAEESRLLEIAAVYHDVGYLFDMKEHERAGAKVAQEVLPGFGFSSDEIDTITSMILATRLPTDPKTLAEQILADADLLILGDGEFFNRSEALRLELAARGRPYTPQEWYKVQLEFMEEHSYFTHAAQTLFDQGKSANIEELKRLIVKQKDLQ